VSPQPTTRLLETAGPQDLRILIVDDEPANTRLLDQMLTRCGYTDVATLNDAREVAGAVRCTDPDLLLLDIHMPHMSGLDIMRDLCDHLSGPVPLPVLVLTADAGSSAIRRAFDAGARDFVAKPFDHVEVQLRVRNLLETRLLQLRAQADRSVLEARVRQRTTALERARFDLLRRLAVAGEYRDDDTHQHAQRIGRTSGLLAAALGLSGREIRRMVHAAPLHDIGKLAIPDAILLKPGPLTPAEFETVKTHPEAGARILGASKSRLLQVAAEIAATHHERWDGTGYPARLSATAIPLSGRIVAVADVFDALSHERPYKRAWPVQAAAAEIAAQSGRQFDPEIVAAFGSLDPASLTGDVRRRPSVLAVTQRPGRGEGLGRADRKRDVSRPPGPHARAGS
jgi:putative two-component system response regulator